MNSPKVVNDGSSQAEAPATVLIVTRNRLDHVRDAIASALQQDPPVEVVVYDDHSGDGTVNALQSEFPTLRVEPSERAHGHFAQCNRAFEELSSEYIVTLDDDARFSTPHSVRQTLAAFDDPRI